MTPTHDTLQKIRKVHLTTEVPYEKTAGSKARSDVAQILARTGYQKLHLPPLSTATQALSFLMFLKKSMSPDGHILVEYPFDQRKRAYVLYLFSVLTGVRIYTVIHDIAALRFKTSVRRDFAILRLFDGIIAHTPAMAEWLGQQGFRKKLVTLGAFDYCNRSSASYHADKLEAPLKLLYAGNLAFEKASYVYDSGFDAFKNITLSAYGQYFEPDRLTNSVIRYQGMFDPDNPVLNERYHFGLVWEGTSLDTCAGLMGEYLCYNSPHKLSLYISLGLPVIIWEKAAMAQFVLEEGIGVTISSLHELDGLRETLRESDYQAMLKKLSLLAPKIRNGDFLRAAMRRLLSVEEIPADSAAPASSEAGPTAASIGPMAKASIKKYR